MSGVENGGISFGKNQNINFDNFNGIQKKDFDKAGGGALAEPIFTKYDKNKDNVLDEGELQALQDDIREFAKDDTLGKREAKRFFNSLGLEKGHDLKREDLYKFLQTIQADKDSVDRAYTDAETGDTIVQYKPDENNVVNLIRYTNNSDNTHTPKAMAEVFSEDHHRTSFLNDDGTMSIVDVNGNKQVEAQYDANKLLIQTSEIDTQTNEKVTTLYQDDGETIKSKFRQNGAVTEYLDPANGDRVTKRETDKGNGVTETVQFTYNEDGSVTETTVGADGKPVSSVTKQDGQEISSVQYTYEDGKTVQTSTKDGVTTEITTTGEGENVQRVKVEKDEQGNVTSRVNVDENGNPVAYKHKVNQGEYWYNIVQTKYGITDPKTIMEIVHQLKNNAGVKRSSAMMPAEIELPASITLKNGSTVALKDIDAKVEVQQQQSVKGSPAVAAPEEQTPVQDKNPPQVDTNLPTNDTYIYVPKPSPLSLEESLPDLTKANLIIENFGSKFEYDDKGFVISKYDVAGNKVREIYRNVDGSVDYYEDYEYDSAGNKVREIVRNADGSVDFYRNYEYDSAGNEVRRIYRNANGSVDYYFDNKYDSAGNEVRTIYRNADGSVDYYEDYEYDSAGNKVRTIYRNTDGSVKSYSDYEYLEGGNRLVRDFYPD